MRYLILALLCLVSVFAVAQSDITKDSTYIEIVGGKYYQTSLKELENGDLDLSRRLIGTGTALDAYNYSLNGFKQELRTMAADAVIVSSFPRQLTAIKRQSDAIKTLTGMSPLDSIQAHEISAYLLPGWTIKTEGVSTPTDVVFTVTAQGQMRSNLGSAPRNVTLYGTQIRLHNFPSATINTDLHKQPNGNFVTADRRYILRKPGNSQTRAVKSAKKTKH